VTELERDDAQRMEETDPMTELEMSEMSEMRGKESE
jgi:hypothetical protein